MITVISDAILAFGVPLGNKDLPLNLDEGIKDDFDTFVATEAGVPEWQEDMEQKDEETYWKLFHKTVQNSPIDLVTYHSHAEPLYLLVVRDYVHESFNAQIITLDRGNYDPSRYKIRAFIRWCKEHKIKNTNPEWRLVSYHFINRD